jgi:hypothetical protein
MAVNRFAEQVREASAAAAVGVPVGFVLAPVFVVQVQQQFNPLQEIYRRAYEEAQAKVRISRLEKRFFSVWN